MPYYIVRNTFAPKIRIEGCSGNLHSVAYRRCNMSCRFCHLPAREDMFCEYDAKSFSDTVDALLKYGNGFKFTGGEPTLNPHLMRDLRIVRGKGGYVYLDTNGTNPEKVSEILGEGLVDVVGVSLKGLTPHQAEAVSGVRSDVSWGRVMRTVALSEHADVPFILTYVVDSDTDLDGAFGALGALLETYGGLCLKINNLQSNPHSQAEGLSPMDEGRLRACVS